MTNEEIRYLRALLCNATPGPFVASAQEGKPGHCIVAQVFAGPDGVAVAQVGPTTHPAHATADAAYLAAAADALPRLLDEVDRLPDWRPIETAPKDGTPIIATDGHLVFRTRAQDYYEKWPHQEGGPTYRREWAMEDGDSVGPWRPTHWIPMPILLAEQEHTR